jgi:hypothetical protein
MRRFELNAIQDTSGYNIPSHNLEDSDHHLL